MGSALTALADIVPGLSAEYAMWIADALEDGSRDVEMREVRVLAEPSAVTAGSTALQRVARIAWRAGTGEVEHLWVRESLRREGVATRLWTAARGIDPGVRHSAWRTDEGDAWARSVGGHLPERKRA